MKKSLVILLILIFPLSSISLIYGQEKMDAYLGAQVEAKAFKGSVFIQHKGEILLDKAYGMAYAEFEVPNTSDTKFLIGSLTKPFTAWAVLKVFAKRDLSLESPISDFGYTFPEAKSIQIHHLLKHSSGLRDYPELIETPTWERFALFREERSELIQRVVDLGFHFLPGEGFRYSNTGYILLGSILEKITGNPFEEVIQEEILIPYSLAHTGVISNRKMVRELASGYTSDPRTVRKAAAVDYSLPFSSGNMYTSSQDLFSFWKAVSTDTSLPATWRENVFPEKGEKYGYGWAEREFFQHQAYGHYGRMSGFVSSLVYVPEEDLFLTFLANEDNTSLYGITQDLMAIALNKPYDMPVEKYLLRLIPEDYEPYVGVYEIAPGDTIKVFEEGNKYYLQETGQMRHEIFPFEQHKFFFSLLEFDLIFEDIKNGKAGKLILRRKELEIFANRLK